MPPADDGSHAHFPNAHEAVPAVAYGLAVALVSFAFLVRYVLQEQFDLDNVPYLQFYPAVIIAAWYGGLGPGIAATALSAVAAAYFLLPPAGFAVEGASARLSLGVFAGTGFVIAWLNHRLHAAEAAQRSAAATAVARAERLAAILDTAVDGIIVIDARGRVEGFNPAAERMFGYAADEAIGRNVDMLMPSPYREEHDTYLSRYMETGRAKVIGRGREVRGRRKDGSTFPLHLAVGHVTFHGEPKFTGILHDLSDRVALEDQLREQAALARLGEMAAVIAHEVKNPLAGIRGAIQIFGSRMAAGDAFAPIVKEIVSRIDSLDRMMKDLLLFARPPQPSHGPVDVRRLVTSIAGVLKEDPALREVDLDIHGDVPTVSADADMLKTVFQNLLLNSGQAMHGKGRIDVAVETVDSMCRIAFADEGPGIPAEMRAKIFTPFFTTKSRGSGLGLPTARRLIEAHHGEITIECPAAGGTTVVVRLPIGTA